MPQTDPNADFQQFVREVVQEVNSEKQVPNTVVPTATPQPISVNVAGQTFTYNSPQELEAALNNFTNAVSNKMGELQQQATVNRIAPTSQVAEGSFVTGNEPVWSNETFIQKMTEDPRTGLEYWLNHAVFEGKSEAPTEDIKRYLAETELTKRSIAAYQFKENHPEFPGGQQAAQIIDQVRNSLGLPYDYNGLEAAYLVAIQRQALPNYYVQAQAQAYQAQQAQIAAQAQAGQAPSNQNPFAAPQVPNNGSLPGGVMDPKAFNGGFGMINMNAQQQAYAQNPYLNAPPSVGRNVPNNFAPNIDPESLTIEQLEAIFARAGHPVQGQR